MQPLDLLSIFISPLEHSGFDYMVTGSVATTLYGEPRLTHDVDLVLMLKISDINRFISCFPQSAYYCPPAEIIRIELHRKDFAHFNLIHHDSGYKADCYPFTGNPLHSWALSQRRRITIQPNLTIQVAPPEYVILRKMQYFKEGGSQKHLLDIQKMIHTTDCQLDHSILDDWIRKLGLENVWEKVSPLDG
jgi:hypothetical protein